MPELARRTMQTLYGHDLWTGFVPTAAAPEVQGWHGDHQSLRRLAATAGETVVIDVGVWKGQSTITMASAMRAAGINGCVIGVDTFLGSYEHWTWPDIFTRRHGRPDLYETFLSNVVHAGLTDYIVPLPQTSTTAAAILRRAGIRAAVVHIDAAHAYPDVLRDAEDYWQILTPGGFLVGDDYNEGWDGVVRAAGEFSARVGRPLAIEPPKWILQKPAQR